MPPAHEDELIEQIEQLRAKIRSLPPGSDLCDFLDREVTGFARRLREELISDRQSPASTEADFSPSSVPPLQGPSDDIPGAQTPPDHDNPR